MMVKLTNWWWNWHTCWSQAIEDTDLNDVREAALINNLFKRVKLYNIYNDLGFTF